MAKRRSKKFGDMNVETYQVEVAYHNEVHDSEDVCMVYLNAKSMKELEKKVRKEIGKHFKRIESVVRLEDSVAV